MSNPKSIAAHDVIFLLGAGASRDAGIPVSGEMVDKVEERLQHQSDWMPFLPLYHHVKSAIHFAAGIRGTFGPSVPFHIETLVNTLYELERNEEHPLYPFIAAWNSRFVGLAGRDFDQVRQFRRLILAQLKDWMCPERANEASYLRRLITLQKDIGHPLRIFTLNYDLLIEELARTDFVVETGFEGYDPNDPWDFERFDDNRNTDVQVYLYKLHGSINWKRNLTTKNLYRVRQIQSVEPDKMEVIFGRDFKLEAADPYLFFAYAFRQHTLAAKLIVVIGYGFGDSHINNLLTQSMRARPHQRLMVVQACSEDEAPARTSLIAKKLEIPADETDRLIFHRMTAREFLDDGAAFQRLVESVPLDPDEPF